MAEGSSPVKRSTINSLNAKLHLNSIPNYWYVEWTSLFIPQISQSLTSKYVNKSALLSHHFIFQNSMSDMSDLRQRVWGYNVSVMLVILCKC